MRDAMRSMPAAVAVLGLELGLVLAWSSGFIGARLAADTPSVFQVLFWRFVVAGLVLSPVVFVALRRGGSWPALRLHLVLGGLAMFLYLGTGTKAIDLGVPAGLSALIGALQPLATAALAGPLLGESVGPRQWLGLVVAFLGVALAVAGSLGDAPAWAYGLAALGVAALVAATLIAKAAGTRLGLLAGLGIQCAVTAVLFLPLAAAEGPLLPELSRPFVLSVAWLLVFSTVAAYGLYWLCLRRSSATRVASLIYLTPPTTMAWAWLQFGEPMTKAAIAGFAVCVIGVIMARAPRARTGVALAPAGPPSPKSPMSDSGYLSQREL